MAWKADAAGCLALVRDTEPDENPAQPEDLQTRKNLHQNIEISIFCHDSKAWMESLTPTMMMTLLLQS
jgi:hypothetical protein